MSAAGQGLLPDGWQSFPPVRKLALLQRLRAMKSAPITRARAAEMAVAKVVHGINTTEEFLTHRLGWRPTEAAQSYGYVYGWSPDQQLVIESVRDNPRTAVPAGHGVGKTKICAGVAVDFLYRNGPLCKVITTAPTWLQVETLLWGEIRHALETAPTRLPFASQTLTSIKLSNQWYALGLSTRSDTGGAGMGATRFQGHHSPRMLIIFDEATGVPEDIKIGAEGLAISPDDRYLAIGNPTDPTSWFKAACDGGRWNVITLDCRNHPNVIHRDHTIIPGAVSYQWVQDRLEEYGGEDTPLFRAKVAGLFPNERADVVIRLATLEKQQLREPAEDKQRGEVLSCDVARFGDDLTTIGYGRDHVVGMEKYLRHRDTQQVGGELIKVVEHRKAAGRTVRVIVIDDTGVGGGVTDMLKACQKLGYWVDPATSLRHNVPPSTELRIWPINFAQSAWDHRKFAKIKDEMWWTLREALEHDIFGVMNAEAWQKLNLPLSSSYLRQLTSPVYVLDTIGRIDVLDKRDPNDPRTVSLPAKSPDVAHAIMLAGFAWVRMQRLPQLAADAPKTTAEILTQQFHDDIQRGIQKAVSRDRKLIRKTLRRVR